MKTFNELKKGDTLYQVELCESNDFNIILHNVEAVYEGRSRLMPIGEENFIIETNRCGYNFDLNSPIRKQCYGYVDVKKSFRVIAPSIEGVIKAYEYWKSNVTFPESNILELKLQLATESNGLY